MLLDVRDESATLRQNDCVACLYICRLLVSRLPPCLHNTVYLWCCTSKITWGVQQTAHRMFSISRNSFVISMVAECNFTNKAESIFNRIGGCHEDYVLNHINLAFNSDTWRLSDFVHSKIFGCWWMWTHQLLLKLK